MKAIFFSDASDIFCISVLNMPISSIYFSIFNVSLALSTDPICGPKLNLSKIGVLSNIKDKENFI